MMAFTAVVTPLCGYIADTFSISWGTLTTIPLLVALLIAGLARKPESDKRVKSIFRWIETSRACGHDVRKPLTSICHSFMVGMRSSYACG